MKNTNTKLLYTNTHVHYKCSTKQTDIETDLIFFSHITKHTTLELNLHIKLRKDWIVTRQKTDMNSYQLNIFTCEIDKWKREIRRWSKTQRLSVHTWLEVGIRKTGKFHCLLLFVCFDFLSIFIFFFSPFDSFCIWIIHLRLFRFK